MSYGDGHTLSTGYDGRLRPTTWNVSNVLGYNYTYQGDYIDERTGRVSYAQSIYDATLDRSYEYDLVGRLAISHSGAEARAHSYSGQWGTMDGPYSQGYDYDVWGNVTHKYGWGGEVQGGGAGQSSDITYTYTGNRRNSFAYDAAGNVTNDGTQSFSYDATGQQTYATGLGAGGSAPMFTDDPLNPPNGPKTEIKLIHLTQLRAAVDQLRARAGLSAATWNPDPDPHQNETVVHHNHIQQLRTKLEEALNALHLPVGSYAHSGPNQGDTIYAVDFQELRDKIKAAWTALASSSSLYQSYDGDGLRVKKTEYGWTTFYLRSSVLGGQGIAEIDGNAVWQRGYVYAGSSLLAVQQGGVFWMHEDPVTKSKRTTDVNGNVVSAIETDPWGADTNRSSYAAFQPRKYSTYERDGNGSDEAMFRRYNCKNSRFDQPDPYHGSYDATDPQSFNRYAYVQNDPVNFIDPTGLYEACVHEAMTKFLARLAGHSDEVSTRLGGFAGDKPGGADSWEYAATNPKNIAKAAVGAGPSVNVHFASEAKLASEIANFAGYMSAGRLQAAAFVLHSIQDVHGAHQGYSLPEGHAIDGPTPDRIIGDAKFMRVANESFQVLSGQSIGGHGLLSPGQINQLIDAIVKDCGDMSKNLQITRPPLNPTGGGGGPIGEGQGDFGYAADSPGSGFGGFVNQINSNNTAGGYYGYVTGYAIYPP